MVKLKGPRYWAMDMVASGIALVGASHTYIGGLKMVVDMVAASFSISSQAVSRLCYDLCATYAEKQVRHKTTYVFRADKLIYVMNCPQGKTCDAFF
ncbi:hypothetical protein EON65_52330 [archaeon]|nr:MAG: hypothetical protein EON65_52330 [archaeon]